MIRASVVFLVVGLIGASILYDRVDPIVRDETIEPALVITPSVNDPARLDAAWYCPVGSSIEGGYADHTVQIANFGDNIAVASLGTVTDSGRGPTSNINVAPRSSIVVDMSTIVKAEAVGAVVEIIGGTGVVSHQVTTAHGVVGGPCATHVSSSWYFAAGRTTRDSSEILALMNPFPEDVVFNMEFHRAAGRPRLPAELQGATIPANSVQLVRVEEHVAREEDVAVAITTVRGRLVAERLQTLDGEMGPSGASLQLGALGPAESWMLSAGRVHADGDDRVIVFNPSETETAEVNVDLWPLNPTDRSLYGLTPIPRQLLPGRFEVVDLAVEADRFGLLLPYDVGVSVSSTNGVPVVAERWQFGAKLSSGLLGAALLDDTEPEQAAEADETAQASESESDEPLDPFVEPGELDLPGIFGGTVQDQLQPTADAGISVSRGTEVLSTRWIIPWVPTPSGTSSVVVASSPTDATIEVFTLSGGVLQGPSEATIQAGGRVLVPIAVSGNGSPILIVSDAPISVEGYVVEPGVGQSVIPGIPTVYQ